MKTLSTLALLTMASFTLAQSATIAWSSAAPYGGAGITGNRGLGAQVTATGAFRLVGTATNGAVQVPFDSVRSRSGALTAFTGIPAINNVDVTHTGFAGMDSMFVGTSIMPSGNPGIDWSRFDPTGGLVARQRLEITPVAGVEQVDKTNLEDPAQGVWIMGRAQGAVNVRSFGLRLNPATGAVLLQFEDDIAANRFLEAANYGPAGNFAMGLRTGGNTLNVSMRNPAGGNIWITPLNANPLDPASPHDVNLAIGQGGELYASYYYTDTVTNLRMAGVARFNPATGAILWNSPGSSPVASTPLFQPEEIRATGANVLVAGRRSLGGSNFLTLRRLTSAGVQVFESLQPTTPFVTDRSTRSLFFDAFGESYTLYGDAAGFSRLYKHSTTGVLRYTVTLPNPTPLTGAAATIERQSGDFFISTRGTASQFTAIVRQAPVAINDGFNLPQNTIYTTPRAITSNDRHALGATRVIVTAPANGSAILLGNGQIRYTPNANFVGQDTLTYRLSKPGVANSTATVTFNVL